MFIRATGETYVLLISASLNMFQQYIVLVVHQINLQVSVSLYIVQQYIVLVVQVNLQVDYDIDPSFSQCFDYLLGTV